MWGSHDELQQAAPAGFFANLLDAIDSQEIASEEAAVIPQEVPPLDLKQAVRHIISADGGTDV